MGNFFKGINEYLKQDDWYELCDWIFEDHFNENCWNRGYIGQFIKSVKKIQGIRKDAIKYGNTSELSFPKSRSRAKYLIMSCKGKSEGADLIRHIRNGIAHDNATVFLQDGIPYVDFYDYRDNQQKVQTAYIHVPLTFIVEIKKIYSRCFNNAKKRKVRG